MPEWPSDRIARSSLDDETKRHISDQVTLLLQQGVIAEASRSANRQTFTFAARIHVNFVPMERRMLARHYGLERIMYGSKLPLRDLERMLPLGGMSARQYTISRLLPRLRHIDSVDNRS